VNLLKKNIFDESTREGIDQLWRGIDGQGDEDVDEDVDEDEDEDDGS
jgi:hypothetical protein